jgi:hypothetical protein
MMIQTDPPRGLARQRTVSAKRSAGRFRRESLPDPITYFTAEGLTLRGQGKWRQTRCPFHDDSTPSMSVNIDHGGWRCHACGVSGDLLGFHMRRHAVTFVQAARDLGAWEELP